MALWLCVVALAQQPKKADEQNPPEEDESLTAPKEYTFNPLQAAKEIRIGNYYFKKGSFKAAAIRFEEATKWNPGEVEAYLRLGEARERQRDLKAAVEAYTKYVELAPDAKNTAEIKKKIQKIRKH
jgi:tetratricopeptide (TPR) repeat protein